jgi:hypothetical protein
MEKIRVGGERTWLECRKKISKQSGAQHVVETDVGEVS